MSEEKIDIQEILENMKEWSVDGNLYFEINDKKAKLLYKYICDLQQEIERLQNIIKEAREYAGDLRLYDNESIEFEISTKLFDILDKENK